MYIDFVAQLFNARLESVCFYLWGLTYMTTIDSNARFHCQWPEGYGNAEHKDVDATFFSEENCYDPDVIAAIAALEVGQTYTNYGALHEKHTVTRLPDAGKPLYVLLDSVGNIDFDENPNAPMEGVPTKTVMVQSLAEASQVCRDYLDKYDLGGGNWAGGLVTDENDTAIAEISYNGRINPEGYTSGNAARFKRMSRRARP
jgi:hypothetical protein